MAELPLDPTVGQLVTKLFVTLLYDLVLANRMARKNVSEMTYFLSSGT